MKAHLEKRMYFLVMYNISPIQQAIQAGHAQMEYALQNWDSPEFQDWAQNWKTWIILNGGTSNENPDRPGTLQKHMNALTAMGITFATFCEPDINDTTTAIAFIVDERVFNTEVFPDDLYDEDYPASFQSIGGRNNYDLRLFLRQFKLA